MSPSTAKPTALRYMPALCVLAFIAAAATQGYKQVAQSKEILDRGAKSGRYLYTLVEQPRRGSIFTGDGEVAAQNQTSATVGIRFDKVPNAPGFFLDVAEATGISATELQSFAADPKVRSREWSRPLSSEQAARLEKIKSEWRADGLSVLRDGIREYPLGASISSLIGMKGKGVEPFGLERSLNGSLSGKEGKTVGMVDRDGSFLPMRLDRQSTRRVDGADVQLTIDSEIQQEATRALRRTVESVHAASGVAIVLRPNTGDVLAMANWPSFDPEDPGAGDGDVSVGVNPNYMMTWEPGSTFKILTLAMALEDGKVSMNGGVQCNGALSLGSGRQIRCDEHHGVRAHGYIDSTMAIAKSCNVSAATWALRVGYDDFTRYLDRLGVTSASGLPLSGERPGGYNRDEYAKKLQLATFGFGQSITVTPLGLASAISSLANGGVRMKPRLIQRIGGKETPVESTERVFSVATCDGVLDCMQAVMDDAHGTGHKLRIPGYELGGKTGTAQKIGPKTIGQKAYVSNFVGFVPAKNPQAIILVMIDNPKTKYYGAEVAGPVFLDIASATISRLHIPKSGAVSSGDASNLESYKPVVGAAPPSEKPSPAARPERLRRATPRIDVKSSPMGGPRIEVSSKSEAGA